MLKVILFSPNGYVGSCIKEELNKHQELETLEITRESNWDAISGNYDVFIYSASVTSARNASADQYIKDNALCATAVAEFCRRHFIKRVIYLSTDEIYGQLHVKQADKDAVMVSPNIYAVTKYLAEKIIVESGISYYILRLSGIVGRRWGCSFLYRLMDKAAGGEEIILYNAGNDFNNVVYIDDLTDFILLLIRRNDYADSRIFLLGNTKKMRLQDLAEYIKEVYQSDSTIEQIDKCDGRYFTLDVSEAVEYGYHSKDIRDIIKELYQLRQGEIENQKFRPGGKDYIVVNDEKKLKIDEEYIEKLKKQAIEKNHSKFTVCLHNDVRTHVHEMIQIYGKHEYVRPHYHPQKTETKIILEGELLVVIYDMSGQELDRFVMSRDKGSIFTFRMDKGIIHTNIPLTNVVFHEIVSGPYLGKADSVFPEWAPSVEDTDGVKKYMDDLLRIEHL